MWLEDEKELTMLWRESRKMLISRRSYWYCLTRTEVKRVLQQRQLLLLLLTAPQPLSLNGGVEGEQRGHHRHNNFKSDLFNWILVNSNQGSDLGVTMCRRLFQQVEEEWQE